MTSRHPTGYPRPRVPNETGACPLGPSLDTVGAVEERRHWLVDGLNVIGSRPDGWWRDRVTAKARLVAALDGWAQATGAALTVVLDGHYVAHDPPSAIQVRFAPGGPDAADDAIVRWLEEHPARTACVVTSDAGLSARVRALGADVEPAGRFRARFEPRG